MGTVAPLVFKQPQFDPDKDLAPVATVGLSPLVVAVAANSPVQSLADLVRLSKANPGKLNFAAPQLNSLPHLAGELLNKTGSLGLFTVPYRSPPEAVSALLSGDAAVTIDGLPSVLPQVRAGRLRALGVTSARRLPGIDIPAIAETFPGYELTGWFQIMAPAGTPPAIIDRFNADLNRVTASAEIASRLNELGIYPRQDSVKAARDFFDEQQIAMKRVMSELGIQAQ
jgi:tripartite-type tricarboxylate transporter receptor subunit TctC